MIRPDLTKIMESYAIPVSSGSQKITLSQINKRLAILESGAVPSNPVIPSTSQEIHDHQPTTSGNHDNTFLQHLMKQKEIEQKEIGRQVHELYQAKLSEKKVDIQNKLDLLEFTIDFVEKVVEYVPKIIILVGSAFKGDFKLSLCIDLIKSVADDIEEFFGNGLLNQTIKKFVDIKFNSKGEVEKIDYNNNVATEHGGSYTNSSEQHNSTDHNKNDKKKRFFSLRFAWRKKEEREVKFGLRM